MRKLLLLFCSSFLAACIYSDLSSLSYAGDDNEPSVEAFVGGPELKGGGRIQCELPADLHRRNTESKGLGLCVFTSIHHSSLWQNVPQLVEFPKYLIDKGVPGGGYPSKVRDLITKISKERGLPIPDYIQVESSDLEILKAACKTGRMPAVTYGLSPTRRYNGQTIAHMVNCVHADNSTFVVLDNNYTGANNYEHMSPEEFLRAYRAQPGGRSNSGWSVILLNGSPPPIPIP
jgi:hypothetical protein